MNKPNDERLLDLRSLVRARLARDLITLANITNESTELTMEDLLEALHTIYVNYIQQNALLNSAGNTIRGNPAKLREEINRLKQIDG